MRFIYAARKRIVNPIYELKSCSAWFYRFLYGRNFELIQAVGAVLLKDLFKALRLDGLDKVKHFWLMMRKPFPGFSGRVLTLQPRLS